MERSSAEDERNALIDEYDRYPTPELVEIEDVIRSILEGR